MPINTKIQLRKGTESEWSSSNPVLASGEPGYVTDSNRFKIGDGVSSWNSLSYTAIVPSGFLAGSGININLGSLGTSATIGVSGLNSSYISDFNSAVSGLLPVKDITAGIGIDISSSSGIFTITSTGSGVLSDASKAVITTVFNKTPNTINKGSVVYIDGGQGDQPTIQLAIASGEGGSSKTYGITAENILSMELGDVVVLGALTGFNTDQFNPTAPTGNVNGVTLYLSPSVSGAITTTKPLAPDHLVSVGTIIRTHQNEGVIEVRIQNGFELEELHNVAISGVSNGQFLQYNSSSGLWVPSSSGNFTTLQLNGTGVSISGHTHTSSNITDFNSSVSGLLPVKNIVAGSGIIVSSTTGTFTISASGGGGGTTISNYADNRLLTSDGTTTGINGESNLTFDGSTLTVIGSGLVSSVTGVTPNALYHIYSSSSGTTLLNVEGTNGSLFSVIDSLSGSLMSVNNSAGLPVLEVFSDDKIVGGRFNQNDFVITTSGDIGLGTANPSGKLHVVGSGIFASGLNIANQTASAIASFDSNKNVVSLSTSTYPSLTELSYVKGVTSAIQTQLNGKSATGHTHTSSDITNFNSSVSGLLPTISNSGDNRLLTSTGTTTGINAESNATFDGSTLVVSGALTVDNLSIDGNTISSTNTDGNIIIKPNGTGALQKDSAGNARGSYAVDLQKHTGSNDRVASGGYSTIGGGRTNTCSGYISTVGGGVYNRCNGYISSVGGGLYNQITNTSSMGAIGGGNNNYLTANYATIGGGDTNNAGGAWAFIGGGQSNNASSNYGVIVGGSGNATSAVFCSIGGGQNNSASITHSTIGGGKDNIAGGNSSVVGGGFSNACSGNYSTIGGGYDNTCSGNYSVIAGGRDHSATGLVSTIGGGQANTATAQGATVGGGVANNATAIYSTVPGGYNNNAVSIRATIGGGESNYNAGNYGFIGGGQSHQIFQTYGTIPGGSGNTINYSLGTIGGGQGNVIQNDAGTIVGGIQAKTNLYCETSHAAGNFANVGDAQHSILIARRSTTDATVNQALFLNGSSSRLVIPAKTTWTFSVKISAYNDTDNEGGWWIIRGGIRRNGSNGTALIGSLITENGTDTSLNSASASVVADDTNEALEIRVTGVASKNIRWVAVVDISQVSYGTP